MTIKTATRTLIKGYLEGFIQGMIDEHKGTNGIKPTDLRPPTLRSKDGNSKPFHEALLPNGILLVSEFERSFSTKLGTTFEECARLIAKDRFAKSIRQYSVSGYVPQGSLRQIERIVSNLNSHNGMTYFDYISQVLTSNDGESVSSSQIADLYIEDSQGNELYIELKSPKPNKGQCEEVTNRMLNIHAIRHSGPPSVRTFLAMAYNPYGTEKSYYNHSFTKNYLDIDNQVLIGSEFWEIVGGPGTYEEVVDIYREVGREKGPDMIDQLALDY